MAPAELESLLLSHADVTDAAVVGVASELHGQVPHAWVVRRQGSECTEAEVIKWFAGIRLKVDTRLKLITIHLTIIELLIRLLFN